MGSNPIVASMKRLWGPVVVFTIILSLVSPKQVKGFAKNFLEYSAGTAAFFEFTGPTNLASNLLRNQFRVIEMAAADYLVGSVACEGYEGDTLLDAKVLVHNSGWVVAYFPKDRPLSQIVDLKSDPVTRLDKVLARIAFALGVDPYITGYTHFQHQDAASIVRIGKAANQQGEFSMDVRLPGSNEYYDQGWHLRIQNSMVHGWYKLDQIEIGNTPYGYGSTKAVDGRIASLDLVTNARHVVTIGLSNNGWGFSYGELVLLMSGDDGVILTGADWINTIPLQAAPPGLLLAAADVPFIMDFYLPLIVR